MQNQVLERDSISRPTLLTQRDMSSLRTNWELGERGGQPRSLHLSFLSALPQDLNPVACSGSSHAPHVAGSPAKWRPQTPTPVRRPRPANWSRCATRNLSIRGNQDGGTAPACALISAGWLPSGLQKKRNKPLTGGQCSTAPQSGCAPAVGNSCPVRLCQARRLDGCLPNDRTTAAFTQSLRSNYLENGGHRPHSCALIEFQYLPRAALT